jgi:hypothetical protein
MLTTVMLMTSPTRWQWFLQPLCNVCPHCSSLLQDIVKQMPEEGEKFRFELFVCVRSTLSLPVAESSFQALFQNTITAQLPRKPLLSIARSAVDGMWRAMMKSTRAAPSAIAIAREVSRVTQLVECNTLLEEVQKGLAAYLEKKRLFFPR